MNERLAPAQTYELNVLASAIGRFAIPNIDPTTMRQADELTDMALQRLTESDRPEVPCTMPELIGQAVAFDEKLRDQLLYGPASELMEMSLRTAAQSIVATHLATCNYLLARKAPQEQLIDPDDIAKSYGIPAMWEDAPAILDSEVVTWGEQTAHPSILPYLIESVSETETQELVKIIWEDILAIDHELNADVYTTPKENEYHLFWAPKSRGLDYATPGSYQRATQLSFDLPHNVAHLAHLAAINSDEGVNRYADHMEERAFFEAVAVLSEYVMTQTCLEQPESVKKMLTTYGLEPNDSSARALSQWIVEDRSYEFKLRAARLYADMLVLEGAPFREIVGQVSDKLGLPENSSAAEAKKYLPWTGLGAIYTMGYRALLSSGVTTVSEAIIGDDGSLTTWTQFDNEPGRER